MLSKSAGRRSGGEEQPPHVSSACGLGTSGRFTAAARRLPEGVAPLFLVALATSALPPAFVARRATHPLYTSASKAWVASANIACFGHVDAAVSHGPPACAASSNGGLVDCEAGLVDPEELPVFSPVFDELSFVALGSRFFCRSFCFFFFCFRLRSQAARPSSSSSSSSNASSAARAFASASLRIVSSACRLSRQTSRNAAASSASSSASGSVKMPCVLRQCSQTAIVNVSSSSSA
mmetsp:Transcript_88260/g.248489  ORF Transcript_88260/g.248489 Transcript_88260/m.248489 type:complete len:236 (-) Transcript_88260:1307-2014(-)